MAQYSEQHERGVIRDRDAASQIRDFSGLRFGTKTPTDVDAVLDINNQAWVFVEYKYQGAAMPRGQQLALERLADDCAQGGKPTLLIVAEHTATYGQDIDCAAAGVTAYRVDGEWHETLCGGPMLTVRRCIEWFLRSREVKP